MCLKSKYYKRIDSVGIWNTIVLSDLSYPSIQFILTVPFIFMSDSASSLEITLESFNYKDFIPLTDIVRFKRSDTLYNFLAATLDDADNIRHSQAYEEARKAAKTEWGVTSFDDECSSDERLSPAVKIKKQRCTELSRYYDKNSEKIQSAAMSLIQHPDARSLYYTLSSQTEPDPKPVRLIQDKVISPISIFTLVTCEASYVSGCFFNVP